jgi:type VI secretion system protein ImpK
MQEAVADQVFPVLLRALELKERLEAGEELNFDLEHAALQGMLLADVEARRFGDGEAEPTRPAAGWERAVDAPGTTGAKLALGVRYALACWLDEFFINFSPWAHLWNERKLETALYASNDRAWKFWEQSRQAERRADMDQLELYFLCAMLGFRGDRHDDPAALLAWAEAARSQHGRRPGRVWPPPPEQEPPTSVPPLRARQRLRRALIVTGAVVLLLAPLATFFVVQQLR